MQKCYINSRHAPTADEWPPYQPKHYTTLALIHYKDISANAIVISVAQELAIAGKFQPKADGLSSSGDIYSNITKNISDIFVPVTASDGVTTNPCIVLIEGAPGIGKTVLAKEIAFQWANKKLLKDKKILLLLLLREFSFSGIKSIESFVQHVVKSEMAQSLTKYLLKTEGKNLAIVFDGYDEISDDDRRNSIITDIVYRRVFAKCSLVITSRPTASSALHSIVDCRVEVVGFTEEDRLDYIQTALQGNDYEIEALIHYLYTNPTINALCYIPLNMTILLCLIKDGITKLPKTQTDIYKKFVEMTIRRFIQKINIKSSEVISNITRLPCPYNEVFKELTRLAYNALKIDKIVFKLNEIEEVCPNLVTISSNWNGLGLLKAVQHANAELGNVTFHFLHFSIQEYMAALYISTLSDSQQIKLLKDTFWEHRYYNTWIMYVGITCGSSFALKHFLSGNRFQLFTRWFKTSSISEKFLENKIKCLHLFQCLVESNNVDIIPTVRKFFQGSKIDLSNQTLLSSDINTLGFFLTRSINKRWEVLDLSGCNIGSIGIKVLCDRFLSTESREMVAINLVDFSYNHLKFSSLIKLFHLCKSWHASQLIINDSKILQNYASTDIYGAIEDVFSSYDKQIGVAVGSSLFGHKIYMSPTLLNTVSIKSLYMLNCTLTSITSQVTISEQLTNLHLINTPLPKQVVKKFCSDLLNTGNTNLFIYDPELPDQDADEICSVILSSRTTAQSLLIISKTKIQGIINTFNISGQLTKLEIANLAINIDQKCFDNMETLPWKGNLNHDTENNDNINNTFIELLRKIVCNEWSWNLRIVLTNMDTLIAYKVNFECISEKIRMYQPLKSIYLSDCNITSNEYQILFDTKPMLTSLYILNGYVDQNCLITINTYLLLCKQIFVHTLCDINIEEIGNYFMEKCSTVLVTKNTLLGCNPTLKQIALAFQFEPSIDVIKLLHYQGNIDHFDQIIKTLTISHYNWTELDFMNCKFGETEYEILQKHLRRINKKNLLAKKLLKVSSKQLTEPLIPKFIEVISVWKIQHIIFHEIDHTVYECFITQFIINVSTVLEEVFLSVTYNNENDLYFCNFSWNQITRLLESNSCTALFIINCKNLNINELSHVSKLHIINSTLHEDTILNILKTFVKRNIEISISNTSMQIDDKALYNFITGNKILNQSKIKFAAVFKNFMCCYNMTKVQLHLLLSQELTDFEHTIVTSASDTKQMHERELIVLQNKQLTAFHLIGNRIKAKSVSKLFEVSKKISTLKSFGINKCIITSNTANDIANTLYYNKEIEQLYLLNSKLQTVNILNIMDALLEFTKLKVLEISNIYITDQVTQNLTVIISYNVKLQYFSITAGNLCASNLIKISKALQYSSNLGQITIICNNNRVTSIIATAMSYNSKIRYPVDTSLQTSSYMKLIAQNVHISNNAVTNSIHLQEFNTNKNNFQSTLAIMKALQNNLTLRTVCINNENLEDEQVEGIATAIHIKAHLKEIDISTSNLHSTGAITIANALRGISTLTKLHINNNHITCEAADDIGNAISCNNKLQKLDISKNQFQTAGIIKIAKCLQNICTLKKLYISNNQITDEAADDIAAAIYCNTQLQKFDVSRNKLQSKGAIKIAKALKTISTLKKLYISNNYITDDAADHLSSAFYCNTQLQELDIRKTGFHAEGIIRITKALQSISTLKKLFISKNDITDIAAADIASVLSLNDGLQEFDISETGMQTEGIKTIAKALQSITTLTKLYICDNNITNKGANDIAAILSHSTQLQEFGIGLSRFTQNGIVCITKILCWTANLKVLKMNGNGFSCTDEAAESIAAAISSNTELQILDLSSNFFSVMAIKKIAKALQGICTLVKLNISDTNITDRVADDIAGIIYSNTQLQDLEISKNNIQSTGAIKIAKSLQQNVSTLTKLYITNNSITSEAAIDIATAILNYKN